MALNFSENDSLPIASAEGGASSAGTEDSRRFPAWRKAGVLACFFCSGAAALSFESLWFRVAGLAFGNSVWATALVLSSFMGGLALGNLVAVRFGRNLRRPLWTYAALEAVVGVTGIALTVTLPLLGGALAPLFRALEGHGPWINALRFGTAFLLFLVPCVCMGLTLPVLMKGVTGWGEEFGRALGRVYGWNTLGAVLGALAGEGLLLPRLGVRGTALAAGGLSFLAAACAFLLACRCDPGPSAGPGEEEAPGPGTVCRRARWVLVAGFLAGGIFMAMEVLWFRFLLLFYNAYAWNFAVMLAVVLAGISAGGLLAAALSRRPADVRGPVWPLAALGGAATLLPYAAFPRLLPPPAGGELVVPVVLSSLALMFLPAVCSGMLFTGLGKLYQSLSGLGAVPASGRFVLANTLGAMAGPLLAGFWLIPGLGVEPSWFLLGAAYGAVALAAGLAEKAPGGAGQTSRKWLHRAVAAGFLLCLALFPFGNMARVFLAHPRAGFERWGELPVLAREGVNETIQILQRDLAGEPYYHRLVTNGHSMSANDPRGRRYMEMFALWPGLFHPAPRRSLLICYGVGTTGRALLDLPGMDSLDVVDISPDILAVADVVFRRGNRNPLQDPRTRVHVEDGRFFLLTTRQTFDVITGEPPPPGFSGVENLYSREFFQLVHDRLAPGGVVTYWLPVYQFQERGAQAVVRAFLDVFPDGTLWSGSGLDWMLVGIRPPVRPVGEGALRARWRALSAAVDLAAIGLGGPEKLAATFIADGERLRQWAGSTPPLTDDFPRRIQASEKEIWMSEESFFSFMNGPGALSCFQRSPFVANLVPEGLRRAAVPFFPVARLVNRSYNTLMLLNLVPLLHAGRFHPDVVDAASAMLRVNRWEAGKILARHPEALGKDPVGVVAQAADALAVGRLDVAEPLLQKAAALNDVPVLPALRLYCLLGLGRIDAAVAVAREMRDKASPDLRAATRDYLRWVFQLARQEALLSSCRLLD